MSDKGLRTTIWAIVIIFLVLSLGAMTFVIIWVPEREGGEGVTVAVLDSGVNMDARLFGYRASQELKDRVLLTKSFVTTEYGYDTNESVVDNTQYYHGTLVAMQIAGRSFGIAPQAKLIVARCADSEGAATYAALFAAFNWAVNETDADIVNISIGGPMLINDTVVKAINRAAEEKGVLTVISAGNSGDEFGYSTSSIEGPGNALQAITVGAYDAEGVAPYSSVGPLKDHTVKPDLVDSGLTLIALGTSFSAPKVSAKAALLLSYCRAQGYQSTPGLLKAALMQSAYKLPQTYEIYYTGSGISTITAAKEIVLAAPKVNNLPIVSYILPSTLPFSLDKAFRGDIWSFPLTIISSIEQQFSFSTNLNSNETIVRIQESALINQTGLVDLKFVINDTIAIDQHDEIIYVESNLGGTTEIPISLDIYDPLIRIAFDGYHSSWEIDNLFGQFRELRIKLANERGSMVEFTHLDNFTTLADYDVLILADPNSYGFLLNEDFEAVDYYKPFDNSTIDLIVDAVANGLGLFVMSTTPDASEISETNRFLENFNISISTETVPEEIIYNQDTGEYNLVLITEMNTTHPVTQGLTNFDYLGAELNILGDNAVPLAWVDSVANTVVAAYESNDSVSRVVVSGSNFMADNMGLNAKYNSTHNLDFIRNTIEWLANSSLGVTMLSSMQFDQIPDAKTNFQFEVTIHTGISSLGNSQKSITTQLEINDLKKKIQF